MSRLDGYKVKIRVNPLNLRHLRAFFIYLCALQCSMLLPYKLPELNKYYGFTAVKNKGSNCDSSTVR